MSDILYEYNESQTGYGDLTSSTTWIAQTFTPAISHLLKKVSIKAQGMTPFTGVITVSIRATTAGLPSGVDLDSVSFSEALLNASAVDWYQATLPVGVAVTAGVMYAIVIRYATSGFRYGRTWGSSPYAGGTHCISTNSGSTWTSYTADIPFREYASVFAPLVTSTRLTSSFAGATMAASLTDKGGYTVTKRGVAYNITGGDPDPTVDSKVEETGDFAVGAFTEGITGISPGVTVYARPYAYSVEEGYGYGTTMSVAIQSEWGKAKALLNSRFWGYPADASFSAMRAGSYVHQYEPDDTNPDHLTGVDSSMTASPWLLRTFLYFDLQGVPSNFTGVKLWIWVYALSGFYRMILEEGVQGFETPSLANWISQNSITTELARLEAADATAGQWCSLTLNEAGIAFVKTHVNDYCKFCCMTDADFNNNYQTSYHIDQLHFYLPNETGKEPYLEFTDASDQAVILEQALSVASVRQPITTAAPVWTDLSSYLMKLHAKRGRLHEFDRVEPGTAVFTLNNASGDFWRDNTAGLFYPDVQPLTLTRLRGRWKGVYYPLWYGVSEAYQPGWAVDNEGGFTPIIQLSCVDIFKSFNRYKLVDNTSKLTEAEAVGSIHVVLESVDNLHVGQSLKIVEGSQTETKIIQVVSESLKTVIFTTVLAHAYSTAASVKKFPAVLSGQRIKDCVLELGWPVALTDIDDGQCYVIEHTPPAEGTNIIEHIYAIAESEDGIPFIRDDGYFCFQDSIARTQAPLNTSQATFKDDGTPNLFVHPELIDDETFIYNEADIHGTGIQQQQVIIGAARDEQGPRALVRKESQLLLNSDAFIQAFCLASRFQASSLRCESLLIMPQSDPDNLWPKVLDYEISTRITFQLNSTRNPALINKQYHVESIIHDWEATTDLWQTKWQLWSVNRYRAYSCQHDGYFRNYSDGGTYEEMHDAAAADYAENDGSEHNPYTDPDEIVVGQDLFNSFLGFNGSLWRGFLEFDTTNLLTADTPVSAFILLHVKESHIDDNLWNLVVVNPSTLVNPLVVADYHALLAQTTQMGAETMIRDGLWLIVPLNAGGLALLVKEGVTRFGLRSNRDISSLHGATSVEKAIFDNINTVYPPRLLIQLAE